MLKAQLSPTQMIGVVAITLFFVAFFITFTLQNSSTLVEYDVKANVEALTSLISALANSPHNTSVIFILPQGQCTLSIQEDSVELSFPQQTSIVKVKTEMSAKSSIIMPLDMKINPISLECDPNKQISLAMEKVDNEIRFESV
jgi:hypothetical protein